jgi:hypothetical protein
LSYPHSCILCQIIVNLATFSTIPYEEAFDGRDFVIWFESSSLYLSGLYIFSASRWTKQLLQWTKSECTFLGAQKGTLATVNSVQRWWKKGPGQFEAMKTKKARGKIFLSLSEGNINLSEYFTSHVGSHKCGLCDHVSQNKRLIRHAQPSQHFYSEDPSIFKSVSAPAFQCRQYIIEFW